jgi:hypothetical protein
MESPVCILVGFVTFTREVRDETLYMGIFRVSWSPSRQKVAVKMSLPMGHWAYLYLRAFYLRTDRVALRVCHDFATTRLALIRFIQRIRDFSSREICFYAVKAE